MNVKMKQWICSKSIFTACGTEGCFDKLRINAETQELFLHRLSAAALEKGRPSDTFHD